MCDKATKLATDETVPTESIGEMLRNHQYARCLRASELHLHVAFYLRCNILRALARPLKARVARTCSVMFALIARSEMSTVISAIFNSICNALREVQAEVRS